MFPRCWPPDDLLLLLTAHDTHPLSEISSMFTDAHVHLSFPEFAQDLTEVMRRAQVAGVTRMVTIGTSMEDAHRVVEIAGQFPGVYVALGLHPGGETVAHPSQLQDLPDSNKLVAIGETGLDYYRGTLQKQQQRELFQAHLDLARQRQLPVVIHQRKAEADIQAMLRENAPDWRPWGVMHCFAGEETFAAECVELGLMISFSGILTFQNAGALREVAKAISLEHVLLETDCPYLAPHPHRGRRNEPSYIPRVAQVLAQIRGVTIEEVAQVTSENAQRLFRFHW